MRSPPGCLSEISVRPSFFRSAPANAPRTVCCCQPVASQICRTVAPSGRFSIRTTSACLLFARVRGWYDMWLENHGVPHGHAPNGYVPGARLDDSGFYTPNQFSGFELLDAFAYGNFDVGDARLTARLGEGQGGQAPVSPPL